MLTEVALKISPRKIEVVSEKSNIPTQSRTADAVGKMTPNVATVKAGYQ